MTLSDVNSVNNIPFPQVAAEQRRFSSSDSTLAGKIRNIWNTFIALIRGCFEANVENITRRGVWTSTEAIYRIIDRLILNNCLEKRIYCDRATDLTPITSAKKDEFIQYMESRIERTYIEDGVEKNYRAILVPIRVREEGYFTEPHTVLLTLDIENKQARYFDPKGRSMHDCFIENGFPVANLFLDYLSTINWTISETLEQRQKDTFSNGYHVMCQMAVEYGVIEKYNHNDPRQTIIDTGLYYIPPPDPAYAHLFEYIWEKD